jgi:hypothetical protein
MLPPTLRAAATERRFANRVLPRGAAQHAIAARLGLASPSALARCFSLAARFAVAAPFDRICPRIKFAV